VVGLPSASRPGTPVRRPRFCPGECHAMLFLHAERPIALAITLCDMARSPCCPPVAGVRLCPRAGATAAGLRGQGGGGLHSGAEVGVSCRPLPPATAAPLEPACVLPPSSTSIICCSNMLPCDRLQGLLQPPGGAPVLAARLAQAAGPGSRWVGGWVGPSAVCGRGYAAGAQGQ
jgi:hypothetical protein